MFATDILSFYLGALIFDFLAFLFYFQVSEKPFDPFLIPEAKGLARDLFGRVFILQEGLQISLLQEIVHSMAQTAREAGVEIVAGDTKVVNGNGELYINTAGVGFVPEEREVSAEKVQPGDAVIVSGNLGDHHAAIGRYASLIHVGQSGPAGCVRRDKFPFLAT